MKIQNRGDQKLHIDGDKNSASPVGYPIHARETIEIPDSVALDPNLFLRYPDLVIVEQPAAVIRQAHTYRTFVVADEVGMLTLQGLQFGDSVVREDTRTPWIFTDYYGDGTLIEHWVEVSPLITLPSSVNAGAYIHPEFEGNVIFLNGCDEVALPPPTKGLSFTLVNDKHSLCTVYPSWEEANGPGNVNITLKGTDGATSALFYEIATTTFGLTLVADGLHWHIFQEARAPIVGSMKYAGTWNAATNTPALASDVGTAGNYYVVSVGGTVDLNGNAVWSSHDIAVFNGSTWDQIQGGITGQEVITALGYTPANAGQGRTINAQTGTAYTLALTDSQTNGSQPLLSCANASPVSVTVPDNATVAFPVGAQVDVVQDGVGKVTFVPTAGVTINSKAGSKSIGGQYVGVTLIKTAINTWLLVGDLIA